MQIPDLLLIAYDHIAEIINKERSSIRITRSSNFYDQSQTELVSNLRSNSGKTAELIIDQTNPCPGTMLVESNCTCKGMSKWQLQENFKEYLEKEMDRRIDDRIEGGTLEIERRKNSK